ncbi:tautomerase family protein [Longispora sp. K20-0274]|uniref:tautomerase family protein n=1 Tax=Longispora sp. K20-0274 TaxID=3088255 RepID=UPI00399A9938
MRATEGLWVALVLLVLCALALVGTNAARRSARRDQSVAAGFRHAAVQVPPRVTVHARAAVLAGARDSVSDAIQWALVEALGIAPDQRYQRFVPLGDGDLLLPASRSDRHVAVDVELCSGRDYDTKRRLLDALYGALVRLPDLGSTDIDIRLVETPAWDWSVNGRVPTENVTPPARPDGRV